MNSRPGKLTGRHVRKLPQRLLRQWDPDGRVVSARYRVTGYRDLEGAWVSRAKLGESGKRYGYRRRVAGKLLRVEPTDEVLRRSPLVAVEVEIDRGDGPTVYFTTLKGLR